jgi:hypothetical protein
MHLIMYDTMIPQRDGQCIFGFVFVFGFGFHHQTSDSDLHFRFRFYETVHAMLYIQGLRSKSLVFLRTQHTAHSKRQQEQAHETRSLMQALCTVGHTARTQWT